MRIKLCRRYWRFIRCSNLGTDTGNCDEPLCDKTIRILTSLEPEEELETIVHELIHACLWDLDEDFVDTAAKHVKELLWSKGWRRIDQGNGLEEDLVVIVTSRLRDIADGFLSSSWVLQVGRGIGRALYRDGWRVPI